MASCTCDPFVAEVGGKGYDPLCSVHGDHAQVLPTPNDRPVIHELVIDDLRRRLEFGVRKYGTPLQPHNGRDAMRDAYEEALDLCVYLRQAIEERDDRRPR